MNLKWWFLLVIFVVALGGVYIALTDKPISHQNTYTLNAHVFTVCGFQSVHLFNSSSQICLLRFLSDLYDEQSHNSTNTACTAAFRCDALIRSDDSGFCLDWSGVESSLCSMSHLPSSSSVQHFHPGVVVTRQSISSSNGSFHLCQQDIVSFDLGKHLDASFDKSLDCTAFPELCAPSCDDPPSFSLSECFTGNFSDTSMDDISLDYNLEVLYSKASASSKSSFSWQALSLCSVILAFLLSAVVLFIRELVGVRLSRANIRQNLNFAMFGGGLVAWLFMIVLANLCIISLVASPVGRRILKFSRLWLCPYGKRIVVCSPPRNESCWRKSHRNLSILIWYLSCVPILAVVHLAFFFVNSVSLMSYATHLSKVGTLIDVVLHPFSRDFAMADDAQDHEDNNVVRASGPVLVQYSLAQDSEGGRDESHPQSPMEIGVHEI